MNVRIVVPVTGVQQLRPVELNDAIKAAGFTFVGSHDAATVVIDCDAADEQAIRTIITSHLATDWAAADAAKAVRLGTDLLEEASVKGEAQVQTFLNFTPVQLDNWIDTNVGGAATLTALRTACVTAFKVLGRIALAAGRGRRLR